MADCESTAFEQFVAQRKKDLQRIASHTRREYHLSDVQAEAWLMAQHLQQAKGMMIDYLNTQHQDVLLRYLYQHLVRYTERQIRYAIRLDQGFQGAGSADEPHPLAKTLVSDDGRDPLATLIQWETASEHVSNPSCHHSLASAYVHLLQHFDNKMQAVADHLLISISHSYRCCANAQLLALHQQSMPLASTSDKGFLPRAWRRFQIWKTPTQLTFDFEEEQVLWPRALVSEIAKTTMHE